MACIRSARSTDGVRRGASLSPWSRAASSSAYARGQTVQFKRSSLVCEDLFLVGHQIVLENDCRQLLCADPAFSCSELCPFDTEEHVKYDGRPSGEIEVDTVHQHAARTARHHLAAGSRRT